MKAIINQTIETLKAKVKMNLLQIQENQKVIRTLLKQPLSDERSAKLEEIYALNKVLLAENNDFINVQLTLTNFVDKYEDTDIFESQEVTTTHVSINEQECFENTVNGSLAYDSEHPFFNDDTFFQKLMKHYQDDEDYESCGRLMIGKKQIS